MNPSTERAVLAGGCFWGMQDLLRRYPGVVSTRVGYAGGDVRNATYGNHGTHAESIEIIFDPAVISYRKILEFFFQIHDPTTRNRQGNDVGTSYRSAIFYTSEEQKRIAEDTIADVDASGLWPGKVVTEVAPAGEFWEAEPEHQDYLERIPYGYNCHFIRQDWKLPVRENSHPKASKRDRLARGGIIMATRGFTGRRPAPELADRIPPGQSLTEGFPVLSAGPTPRVSLSDWSFTLKIGPRPVKRWTWAEFQALPQSRMTRDIHCVTKWSKLNTPWTGVLIDDLLADAGLEPPTPYTLALSYDGYSTNVPVTDLVGGKAMIATQYEGKPLTPEHGGPARLLVPHLYFWKSAKWINGLQFTERDEAGFWELRGYHIYGDPWREQRFSGD